MTQGVSLLTAVQGASDPTLTWSLSGAGTLTDLGSGTAKYQAPNTMPANPAVVVKAVLKANSAISASYSLSLINPAPIIYSIKGSLLPAATNSVTVGGAGFVPGTIITVNGANIAVAFQTNTTLAAQIPLGASASGTISVVAKNAAPGGGVSPAFQASIVQPSIKITAYNADGTNTGGARLTQGVSLLTAVQGTGDPTLVWSLSGAGTLTDLGSGSAKYQAPNAMPTSPLVVVKAALKTNGAIFGSYSFQLMNPVPVIYSVKGSLLPAATNLVTIGGSGFVQGAKITVNGTSVPVTFQSSTTLSAQVSLPANAAGTLAVIATNPTPGGGASAPVNASVSNSSITITAYNADGTNTGGARLTQGVSLLTAVQGTGDPTLVWSLSGAGTLTDLGSGSAKYQAPNTMPANPAVVVKAVLKANSAISASYSLRLINPAPIIYSIKGSLLPAATNLVTIGGSGFVQGAKITVNGTSVPVTFQSSTTLSAQVSLPANSAGTLAVIATNPTPGGGASAPFNASVSNSSITITAYNVDGTNTGTGRLTRGISLLTAVTGVGDPTLVWSLSGAGTLTDLGSGSAKYQAPDVMPANPAVVIKAALKVNPSVYASYSLKLVNAVPSIYSVKTAANNGLMAAAVNVVTIAGSGFVPGTTVTVNGANLPVTFQSSSSLAGQISLPASASGTLAVVATNPAPGGGSSAVFEAPISVPVIKLNAFTSEGRDPTSVKLGVPVEFIYSVSVAGSSTLPVTWQVQGGGTISASGFYRAPLTMPSSQTVIVTATLVDNHNISKSYQFTLENPAVVVNASAPTELAAAQSNPVTLYGRGFLPTTTVTANAVPAAVTYLSPTSLAVSLYVDSSAKSVKLVAQNPGPGGNTSAEFVIPVSTSTTIAVTVGSTPGIKIPLDFLGFSHEWGDAQEKLGTAVQGINTVYQQLVKNLMRNDRYAFSIRIGGGSTDTTTAPTATTVQAFSDLAKTLPVRFSLGVNLGSNDPQLAATQARAYLNALPASVFDTIEIGNEADGFVVEGYRAAPYTPAQFFQETAVWQSAITGAASRPVKFIGPSWGVVSILNNTLADYEQQDGNNLAVISAHYYVSNKYQTFSDDILLQPASATSGPNLVKPSVAVAHSHGQSFRVDELNSIAGTFPGVSDRFGAALWAADTMFEFAKIGVDGVNWHGMSRCGYCAFTFDTSWLANRVFTLEQASPLYYGMLFFRLATENDAQMLPVTVGSGANVKAWATVDKNGVTHVAIINKDKTFAGKVAINLPGHGSGTVLRLVAPSYQSPTGVSIGGQTFDGSVDGTIVGTQQLKSLDPVGGVYTLTMQPTSAALLTVTP